MYERYSIEVSDNIVEIFGSLTIEEAFDFLNFYEKKGYKEVILGSENSTLRMFKKDEDNPIEDERTTYLKEEIDLHKSLLKSEKNAHEFCKIKLRDVETLLKKLMFEEKQKYNSLLDENEKFKKSSIMMKLEESEVFKKMQQQFDIDHPVEQEQKKTEKYLRLEDDPEIQKALKEGSHIGCDPSKTDISGFYNYDVTQNVHIPASDEFNANCGKCTPEEHDGPFCLCEKRNIRLVKELRKKGKSPWNKIQKKILDEENKEKTDGLGT